MPPLPASAPLLFAHPSHCIRTITRGQVKRCMASEGSPLVAWQVCCPACSFVGSYLPDEALFDEGAGVVPSMARGPSLPWVTDHGEPKPGAAPLSFKRPPSLTMGKAVICYGCRGMLQIADGVVSVVPGT